MTNIYDSLPYVECSGEILCDSVHNWRKTKLKNLAVANVMPTSDKYWLGRYQRMHDCGSVLHFAVASDGQKRLYRANFCRDRMCPACQRRKSLVVFHQVKQVCYSIRKENPTYKFLLLTLTVPNVPYEKLSDEITHMMKSYERMIKRAEVKKVVKGFFRALEITYNLEKETYHPHFHVLLCVPSNYFTKNYIKQERWLELWQEATRYPHITQVDVRTVKANPKREGASDIESASAEVAKYATKQSNYITKLPNGDYIADEVIVPQLAKVLRCRKLFAFGGLMLEHFKKLQMVDVDSESVDLIHTDDSASDIEATMIYVYRWNVGFKNYIGV